MTYQLTQEDRNYIWRVVAHAVEKAGSHAKLFSNRLEFVEDQGRIRFTWPVWMHAIKGYLAFQYGEHPAESLLVGILREVMNEDNYQIYLEQSRLVQPSVVLSQANVSQSGLSLIGQPKSIKSA